VILCHDPLRHSPRLTICPPLFLNYESPPLFLNYEKVIHLSRTRAPLLETDKLVLLAILKVFHEVIWFHLEQRTVIIAAAVDACLSLPSLMPWGGR
jgi:hypothetical protein